MRRWIILSVCSVVMVGEAMAQSVSDVKVYIEKYKFIALEQEKKYGIPASITLAQGILESGAGTSQLTRRANNHFGIKAYGGWTGDVFLAWDDEQTKSRFRRYASAEESFRDHSAFLCENKRYRALFKKSVFDYRGWAIGLQRAGYATAPYYAKALIGYIDAYKLYALNGGVKLKPGKAMVIVQRVNTETPLFDEDCQINEDVKTAEERQVRYVFEQFVVEINNVRCTILYPGETLSSVSKKYDIPRQKLLKYNELGDERGLKEGDIVFLEEKRNSYEGPQDFYKVRKHDTMYGIAQRFGIKLARLTRLNEKDLFSELEEGDVLRLK